jgi:hypothetical protein
MNKVLCGLVIALMMTGSGYADLSRDECNYLKNSAEMHISSAIILDKEVSEIVNGKGSEADIKTIHKYELIEIKRAHYFAVTWSALCD